MKRTIINLIIYIFLPSLLPLFFTNNINSKEYTLLMFITYMLLTIYFIFINKKELKNNIKDFKFNKLKTTINIFIIGIGLMLLSNYIINYLIIPNGISNNELGNRNMLLNNKIIYSILLSLIIPFLEEIVFRLNFKKIIKNKYVYLFLTSIIFSLLHNISDTKIIELLYIIPYFILGYTLGLIYYKTDNIIYSLLAHIFNNTFVVILLLI